MRPYAGRMINTKTLIKTMTAHVKTYMSSYDASHDFSHIKRVVGMSHKIYSELLTLPNPPTMNLDHITLAALLHDIGDRKYLAPHQTASDAKTMIQSLLLSHGASQDLASKIQEICTNVSYSTEIKDYAHNKAVVEKYPELGVVQDADRLDSIGAVGIGRVFTYGGANRPEKGMQANVELFEVKLLRLVQLMKTGPGKRMGEERTRVLKGFEKQWDEDMLVEEFWEGGKDEEEVKRVKTLEEKERDAGYGA